MLKLVYQQNEVIAMIYDGKTSDTTNRETDRFLQINSAGNQNVTGDEITVIRENGRLDYHILLVCGGELVALHRKQPYKLRAGGLVVYAPNEAQSYTLGHGCKTLWCHFGGTVCREVLESCDIESGIYRLSKSKPVVDAFSELVSQFHQPSKMKHTNASLLKLLYCISDAISFSSGSENDNVILPTLTYMAQNYDREITLEELAKSSGYSKSHFEHTFIKTTGTTPMKYLNSIRLKTAYEMVTSTSLPIKDIALSCGFKDALYFSRRFREAYDISPKQLRETYLLR